MLSILIKSRADWKEGFLFNSKARASGYQEDIDAIPKGKADKIVEYIRNAIAKGGATEQSTSGLQQETLSPADELSKLAKLKEQGVLPEAEFTHEARVDNLQSLSTNS